MADLHTMDDATLVGLLDVDKLSGDILAKHLEASHAPYKAFRDTFDIVTPSTSNLKYSAPPTGGAPAVVTPKISGNVQTQYETLKNFIEAKKNNVTGATLTPDVLQNHGTAVIDEMNAVPHHAAAFKAALPAELDAINTRIANLSLTRQLSPERAKAAQEALAAQAQAQLQTAQHVENAVATQIKEISDHTGVNLAPKPVTPIAGAAASLAAEGVPLPGFKGRIHGGADAFGKLTTYEAAKARLHAINEQEHWVGLKGVRAAASAGALMWAVPDVGVVISGVMGGTRKDSQGNEVPITNSDIAGAAVSAGAKALAAYGAVTLGGKSRVVTGQFGLGA